MPLTLEQHLDEGHVPKRILALDGGGLRGVLTLEFLDRIESELRKRSGNDEHFRLCDYFDLIGGTSTGSIIAAALACGMSVAELKTLYAEIGQHVFKRRILPRGILTPKFSSERVQAALDKYLGAQTTMGDHRVRTGLMIMVKRLDTGSPWPIHNHPNARYGKQDCKLRLAEVVRASTAAPTYFSPEHIAINSRSGGSIDGAFVDGGVSPFNDPALQSLMLATLRGYGFCWKVGMHQLLLVSIGTGRYPSKTPTESVMAAPAAKQGILALQSLMGDCARVNQIVLQWLTRCLTPWPIDRAVGDMKVDSEHGPQLATYARYDVVLQREWLKGNLNIDWDDDKIEELSQMDQPNNIHELAMLGRLAVNRQFHPEHLPSAFDLPARR